MTPRTGDWVLVERTKWPDRPHYGGYGWVLGEDEHGTWVGLPALEPIFRGDAVLFAQRVHASVICVPRDDWFMAHWLKDHEIDIYVDVVTPPRWEEKRATMVDLDFDVVVRGDSTKLVDEDEFEEHRALFGYPDELVADARRAAADVFARVASREPPFTPGAGEPWHALLAERVAARPPAG